MSEEVKFVVQYILYPIITAFVGVIVFLYRTDVKTLRKSIEEERVDRKEAVEGSSEDIGKIFDVMDKMNQTLGEIKGKIDGQERICNIRHSFPPWDGSDRRG
jgi:archaellum component FlaC